MHLHTIGNLTGTILLFAGLAIRYWVARRRFNRRNFAGVEVFQSFSQKTIIIVLERILRFLAAMLILSGILLLLSGWV